MAFKIKNKKIPNNSCFVHLVVTGVLFQRNVIRPVQFWFMLCTNSLRNFLKCVGYFLQQTGVITCESNRVTISL